MATDGHIDYRHLTREQLEDALQNISKADYPINFARLTEELARRPPAPPKGSQLPERLVIASRSSMLIARLFPAIFSLIGVVGIAVLLAEPSDFLSHFSVKGETLGLSKMTWAWITVSGFLATGIALYIPSRKTFQVTLARDRLEISDVRRTVIVPLFDIQALTWINSFRQSGPAEIEIRLRADTDFGRTIRCNPTLPGPVNCLLDILEYHNSSKHGA